MGRHSGEVFAVIPTQPQLRLAPDRFLTCIRRRLWLPLGLSDSNCPGCSQSLDPQGFHLLTCPISGRLGARSKPLERTWAQIAREAGARVRPEVLIASLNAFAARPGDQRHIDFVAYGLPIYGGLPLCCDPTLRSPLEVDGAPRLGTVEDGEALLRNAEADKRRHYSDLANSERCVLLPLACSTGGRWSETCIEVIRLLARHKAEAEPPLLRQSYRLAYERRWWGLLSVALHESVAASLDPTASVSEQSFPVVDSIDIWLRDAPAVSLLGAR